MRARLNETNDPKVITCVGETLEQREVETTVEVVAAQTKAIADEIKSAYVDITTRIEVKLEYREERRIKEMVKRHSKFISYSICRGTGKTTEKEIGVNEHVESSKKQEEGKRKKIKEISHEWEIINKLNPIWLRKPEKNTKEKDASFHISISNDWEDHLGVKYFSDEGQSELKAILLTP